MKNRFAIFSFILRIAIGWHFLYEGLIKLLNPEWTSEGYLMGSYGFLSGFFHWLGSDPGLIQVIDFINVWGMILIGTGLFLGILIRIAALSGVFLLVLYYFAYPPFGGLAVSIPTDGHFWIVNRNLIEAISLALIYYLPAKNFSLEQLIRYLRGKAPHVQQNVVYSSEADASGRRELLKGLVAFPFFGGLLWGSISRGKNVEPDVLSGATIALKKFDLGDLKGDLPRGKIGDLEISRLVLGCNLIGGWSHSRDLHYVSQLFRQYNSEKKIIETLSICDQAGINTANMVNEYYPVFNKFKSITGSNMLSICQAHIMEETDDPFIQIKKAMEYGATSIYVQGANGDRLVRTGRMDVLQKAVDFMRSQGYLAGIGAHSVQVPIACEKAGLKPDYYFKTMHHDQYWSAHPREFREEFSVDATYFQDHNKFHDNIFDLFPEQTVEVFRNINVPLFGFKVMAGGAIQPEDGFRYAFENGADFICVGMFDFQVVEDVNLVINILKGELKRSRPWFA